jgi:site-specific DNA-methyltransferase (adenine-specific)
VLLENTIHLGDCLELMKELPDASVDLVLCDLPYGTTANKWDALIPFSSLWEQYKRIGKENCVYALTASQPFTTALINSNPAMFRYEMVWDKTKGGNFALARKQPMKSHENIIIFYRKQPTYNPQMETRGNVRKKGGGKASDNFGIVPTVSFNNTYYPKSIVTFSTGSRTDQFHPTQKPVALFEYLIKTYTNPGDLVLDNCAGSGTTAVACKQTGRRYLCIEKDRDYWLKACERVNQSNGLGPVA